MVPTQFYLFYELLQKLPPEGKARLKQYYPMLRRYYQFFAGKSEGSTTARYKSCLLYTSLAVMCGFRFTRSAWNTALLKPTRWCTNVIEK